MSAGAVDRQVFVRSPADLFEGGEKGSAGIRQLVGDRERWTFVDAAADKGGIPERAVAEERSKLLRGILDQTPSVATAIDRTSREIPVVPRSTRGHRLHGRALMTTR